MEKFKMISFSSKGDFSKTDTWLEKMLEIVKLGQLDKYGRKGVEALRAATPKDSGETANSWGYEITRKDGETKIVWTNSHINKGVNIAVILQYGHGTGTGGYVQGIDYINPAMKSVFQQIVDEALKEVTS